MTLSDLYPLAPVLPLLRVLRSAPYFRGRDRVFSLLASTLPDEVLVEVNDVRLAVDTRELTQLDLVAGRYIEPLTVAVLRRLLNPGDTFVDVGAHAGTMALMAARAVGPNGRVVAIEPQPANCDRLMHNAALNGCLNVLTVMAAAGDQDGWVRLHHQARGDRTRLSLRRPKPTDLPYRFETPIIRVDTLLDRLGIGRADVLKIDVEGFEFEVLRGCGDRLREVRVAVVELLGSGSVPETVDALRSAGFRLQDVHGRAFESPDAYETLPERNVIAVR